MSYELPHFDALLVVAAPAQTGPCPTSVVTVTDIANPAFKLVKHTEYPLARILDVDRHPTVRINLNTPLLQQLAEVPVGTTVTDPALVEQLMRLLKAKP